MYIDINSDVNTDIGEVDLSTSGVANDIYIDLGETGYPLGAGQASMPTIHVAAGDDYESNDSYIYVCYTDEEGSVDTSNRILDIRLCDANKDGVIFSGELPTVPEVTARYLFFYVNGGTGTVKINVVHEAPYTYVYPAR